MVLNRVLLHAMVWLQEEMRALAEREGSGTSSVGKLNNVLMQMRKNCNHPDLITSAFTNDINYPPPDQLVADCECSVVWLLSAGHCFGHTVCVVLGRSVCCHVGCQLSQRPKLRLGEAHRSTPSSCT